MNYEHEDGELGIDGWNGSKRNKRDGLETEYVVAEFEDSKRFCGRRTEETTLIVVSSLGTGWMSLGVQGFRGSLEV